MKPLRAIHQVGLWLLSAFLFLISVPTVSSHHVTIYDDYAVCAGALIVTAATGILLSLVASGYRLSESEKRRRVIALQTIPIWGHFATYLVVGLLGGVLPKLLTHQTLIALK
jgi:hypothetical protein